MMPLKNTFERHIDEVMFMVQWIWIWKEEANGLEPIFIFSLILLHAQDKNKTGFSSTFPNELLMDCMENRRTMSSRGLIWLWI